MTERVCLKTISQVVSEKISEYEQEISQSHTTDQPMAPQGKAIEHL